LKIFRLKAYPNLSHL